MFDRLAKMFASVTFRGAGRMISSVQVFSVALLIAIVPSVLPCSGDGDLRPAGAWEKFTAVKHLPKAPSPHWPLCRGPVGVPIRAVRAAFFRFRPKTRIDFLGKRLGVPGRIDFLRLYPVARRGRAVGGFWHFTSSNGAGKSQTKLIPIGPPGYLHRLHWERPAHTGPLLPPIPGFPPPGSPPAGSFAIYLGAWSNGMARVTGWIPGPTRSLVLSTSGVPKAHALRAFQIDADYSSATASLQCEWPKQKSLWPPDKIVICESFWPFPSARFGAGAVVSKAMLALGLPRAQVGQALATAEKILKRLSPEESFLLQITGVTPPPVRHARKAVRQAVRLFAQASFSYFFHGSTQVAAIFTRTGGKDVYAVSCRKKSRAFGGPWFEYYLCFTKSGRLWCVGHQSWKAGRRTPAQLAAMAVNLSGLSKLLSPSPREKK